MLDASAYERAVTPLLSRAGAYARAVLRNRCDAEDAVQQAAMRAWEHIDQYDQTRSFKAWWFAILRNCCLDVRRRASSRTTQPLDGIDPPARAETEPGDWRALDAAVAKLSSAHQEILRLKYYADLSYAQLSATLGIPLGTVMSRLHLARRALAAQMRKEDL